MKKLLLIFFTAVLFSISAKAQVQEKDTTSADPSLRTEMSFEEQMAETPEIEVVQDKEGPDSQVVYKHNDNTFYVDRDEGKIVEVEESELQDAKHDIIIKGPLSESASTDKSKKPDDDQ